MRTKAITEMPIFTLNSCSYDGAGERIEIYADDLRAGDVGRAKGGN